MSPSTIPNAFRASAKASSSSDLCVGTLFLEALLTGVITPGELQWVTSHQQQFNRVEEATAIRLGRLLDTGRIQLGCRLG
ncbi:MULTISPECIES: hypothetical protein [Aphanothece]|uniref:hypothetical protein n=1 Tax=Aphanothece TaxID=1121 RepID=UPI00398F54F9